MPAFCVDGLHQERVDDAALGRIEMLEEVVVAELVHQEADGATVHAVDRLRVIHEAVEHLQHQAVAAEGHHYIGLLGGDVVVAPHQGGCGLAGVPRRTRHERDFFCRRHDLRPSEAGVSGSRLGSRPVARCGRLTPAPRAGLSPETRAVEEP